MTEFSKGDIIKIEKGTEGQDDYKTAIGQAGIESPSYRW